MSAVLDIKLLQVFLLHHFTNNFRAEEIKTCDCFLECGFVLLEKLRDVRGADKIKEFFTTFLMKSLLLKEKMIALISRISIVICLHSLYQYGYMRLVPNNELHNDCRIDLPFGRVKNCVFYLEDDIKPTDYNSLCFNCKFHFLNFVSVRFYRTKNNAS